MDQNGAAKIGIYMDTEYFFKGSIYYNTNKRAVLGLSANFLNIVIRKNQKNKFFTPKEIFQVWNSNWKQFWTNLNKSRKTALFSIFTEIKGDYRGLKLFKKYKDVQYVGIT